MRLHKLLAISLLFMFLVPPGVVASQTARDKIALADRLMREGYTRKALDFYDLAIRANANFWPAYLKRGDCLAKLGQWSLAQDDYKKVLQLDPGNPQARSRLHGGHKRRAKRNS